MRAGAAAAAAYAYQEALDWYAQALDACDRLGDAAAPVAVDVAEKRGLIQLNLMRLPEMRAEFDRMAAAARRVGDRRREGLALIHRGIAAWMDHAFVEAEANWRAALAVGAAFADVRLAAHLFIAHLCFSLGRHDEARPHRRVAALAAAVVDDPYLKAVHGVITALPFWLAGRFAAAVARLERCRDNTWRSGLAVLRSQHMWAEALARASRGEYAAAQALLREALGASNRCGDALMQGRCLNTLGWIHGELQDWETALALNRQSLEVAQEAHFPDPEVENNARLNVGDALLALGRGDEAAAAFQNVERVVNHPGPKDQWMLWRYAQHLFHSYGELALARGDLDGALAYAGECLQRAEATDSRKNVVKARRLRAQVFLARHELAVAEQEIAQALAVARRLGNPPQLWRTYVTLGEVRRAQGRARDALAAYRAALAVVDGVAAGLAGLPLRETLLSSPHVQDLRRRGADVSP